MEKLLRADLRSALRKFERKKGKQVLAAPNAVLDQKAARISNYELAKADVSRWESTVTKNRLADHLVFPAPPTHRVTMPESNEERKIRGDVFVKQALEQAKKGSDALEAKIFATLYQGEKADKLIKKTTAVIKDSDDEFEPPEKQSLQARLALRRIIRAKQGQLAAKLRQRAKIKSKNFHRHAKRQKVAEEAKRLAELATADPEQFTAEIASVEKRRVEERMTQRHRQGGKWARQMKAFQKLNGKDEMSAMQETAKELLRKHAEEEEEEEEEKMEEVTDEDGWTRVLRRQPEREKPAVRLQDIHNAEMEDEELDVGLQRRTAVEDFDAMETEPGTAVSRPSTSTSTARRPETMIQFGVNATSRLASLDSAPEVESQLEMLVGEQAEELEAEFLAEKEAVAKEEQPAAIDGFLPGWNTWTGPGIDNTKSKNKRSKFTIKAPTLARRDGGQARLMIRERPTGTAYRRHQVREVPFPFETAEAWEAATRQPVGRQWVTEVTHRDLIRPRVGIRMGKIIKPLSRDQLHQRADKGKTKKDDKKKGKKRGGGRTKTNREKKT